MNVLIIGGGVAGLTAGIYAQLKGHKTTILEQHSIAGGNLTGWKRQGFYIDNCIHWLTGTNKNNVYNQIWKDTGMLDDDLKIIKLDSLFTCERNGQKLTLYRNIDKTINEMILLSPEDEKEIRRFGKCVKDFMHISGTGGKNKNKGLGPKSLAKLIPKILKYHSYTTGQYGKKFKNPIFYDFFSTLTGPDFSMIAFIMTASDYCSDNADLPEGGSLKAAQRILNRYKELGGTFIPNSKVVNIAHENHRITSVTTEDGTTYTADKIIATLEPKLLFNNLLHMKMPKKLEKRHASIKYKRFSFLHAAFSIDKDKLPFEGTLGIEAEPNDIEAKGEIVYKEFSYDDFGKGNKTVIEAFVHINESVCKKVIEMRKNNSEKYAELKNKIAEYFKKCLEKHFPKFNGNDAEVLDVWTPASYNRYTGTEAGTFMSHSFPSKKIPIIVSNKVKGLKNLLLATQWQTPPGGLPIAAKHGKKAAKAL